MDVAEVLQQRPVGGHRAQRRLPGVHVGIDQPRQHEVAAAVDRLGIGLQGRRDGSDAAALDQHVAFGQHAEGWVLRDDDAGFEQELHCLRLMVFRTAGFQPAS